MKTRNNDDESLKLVPVDTLKVSENNVAQTFALVAEEKPRSQQLSEIENKVKLFLAKARKKSPEDLADRPFDQGILITELLNYPSKYVELFRLNLQFNGLCELICNYVIMQDLLGESARNLQHSYYNDQQFGVMKIVKQQMLLSYLEKEKFFKNKITLSNLDSNQVKQSHILLTTSIFQKMAAYFLNIFPQSLVPFKEQNNLLENGNTLNNNLVALTMHALNESEYVKFHIFNKTLLNFEGHSCLIKKTGKDKYSFFDPNLGEFQNLDIDKLILRLNKAIIQHKGNCVCLLKAQTQLEKKNVLSNKGTPT